MLLSMFLYVWFASMRWFAKVDSIVEWSAFVCSMHLCLKLCPVWPVSYTHLDVYKRQLANSPIFLDNFQKFTALYDFLNCLSMKNKIFLVILKIRSVIKDKVFVNKDNFRDSTMFLV